jgi:hypothetical protein
MPWKKRVRGTPRQIGMPFPIGEKRKLPKLPKPGNKYRKLNPESNVTKIIKVNPNELVWREAKPVDIDRRAQYFVRMYMEGRPIPPIFIYRMPSGRLGIYDGHARVRAFQLLRVKEIPAILKKDRSGLNKRSNPKGTSPALSNPGILQKLGISGEPEAEYYLTPSGELKPEPV